MTIEERVEKSAANLVRLGLAKRITINGEPGLEITERGRRVAELPPQERGAFLANGETMQ